MAVAEIPRAVFRGKRGNFILIGKQFEERKDIALFGILRRFKRSRVGRNGHDLLPDRLLLAEEFDGVVVALGHLLPVGSGYHGDGLADDRFRNHEDIAVHLIEPDCNVTRDLQMLLLILADGYRVGFVKQDVRRHQNRIGEKSVVRDKAFGDLVLVAVRALKKPEPGDRVQDPREFADAADVGLPEERGLFGIQPACEIVERKTPDAHAQVVRLRVNRQRMQIRDEQIRIPGILVLELDRGFHRPEIVADVQNAGRLDAGENPFSHAAPHAFLTASAHG